MLMSSAVYRRPPRADKSLVADEEQRLRAETTFTASGM